jgi:cytochrome c
LKYNYSLIFSTFFKRSFLMKRFLTVLSLLTMASAPAFASLDLATKNACMACHAVDKKVLGPSYLDVAKKYEKEKDAVSKLAASIKTGGSGKWGPVPMPAQAALSDADAKTLATWILAGAKAK